MLMSKRKCEAKNRSGETCSGSANETGFCFTPDATKGKERAIARRKGGLKRITPHVADASVMPILVSIAHGYLETLKVGELEQHLEAVENAMNLRKQKK